MVYLFVGQDPLSKETRINFIKNELLAPATAQFNFDCLYAEDLNLKDTQEKFSYLPVRAAKRLLVIKNALRLNDDIKEFLLSFLKKPPQHLELILDIERLDLKDRFWGQVYRQAKVLRFKEGERLDAFTLSRSIAMNKPDYALRILNELLRNGERPERILGGLRYAWEREFTPGVEAKRRLKLLLNCDINIKTGKLKPNFALEKLVISLCSLPGKRF